MAYKVGDIVKPNKGPHKGHPHRVIAVQNGGYNIAPERLKAKDIKYRLGAAHAKEEDLTEDAPCPVTPYTYSAALEKWFIAKNKKADVVDAKKEDSQTLPGRKKAIETLQDSPLPEGVLDELSNKVLHSYLKKSADDIGHRGGERKVSQALDPEHFSKRVKGETRAHNRIFARTERGKEAQKAGHSHVPKDYAKENLDEAKKPYQITKKTSNKSLGRLGRRQDALGVQARKELSARKKAIQSSQFPNKTHATKVLGHIIAGKKPLDSDTAEKLIKSLNIPSKSAVAKGIRKTAKAKASAYDRSQKAAAATEKEKNELRAKKKERRSIEKEITKKLASKVKTPQPQITRYDPEDPHGALSGKPSTREKPLSKRPENIRPDVGKKPMEKKKPGLIKRFVQKFMEEEVVDEQVTGPKSRLSVYLEKRAKKKEEARKTKSEKKPVKETVEITEVKKVKLVPGKKISKKEFDKMKTKVRDAQLKRASAGAKIKPISAVKNKKSKDQPDSGGLNDFFLRGPKAVVSALRTAGLKPHAQLQVQKALLEPGNEAKFMKNPREFAKSIVKEERDERIDATITLMKKLHM